MSVIEPPSDDVLCRYVQMAKTIDQCIYAVPENGQWLPSDSIAPPDDSANGEYYEVFPIGGRILHCQVKTHTVLKQVWWSDLMIRQYELKKAENRVRPDFENGE